MEKLTTRIREKGINSMKWIDKEEWRRNIKSTLDTERCESTYTLYINKNYYFYVLFWD